MQGLGRRVADFARQSQAVREARGRIGNSRNVVGIAVEAQAQVGERHRAQQGGEGGAEVDGVGGDDLEDPRQQ